jgi:O-antigen/teichoic acid export membrane protein
MSVHLGERWGGFWRRVTTVLMGTAIAQAIPLLGSLLIARLYAPAEFGLFAVWIGMVALAAVVVTGRYEAALAVEPDGGSRHIGVQAVLLVVTVATGFILVLSLAGSASPC